MVVPFRIVAWRRKCVGLDMKKIIIRIEQDGETGAEIGRKVQVGRGNERRNYIFRGTSVFCQSVPEGS